jgi:GNAT superfamily N-acetyltransferase
MRSAFEPSLESIFYLHPESTLVALYGKKVIAGINLDIYQVNKHIKMGYIGWLYTDENHRGQQLAGKLIDEAKTFLKNEGCTEISACVEGDNPASFKQLTTRGFSILGLAEQLKLFKLGTFKVYHHASRFFDMGYFLYHKRLTGANEKPASTNLMAFVLTVIGNTFLFFACLKGLNILSLFGFSFDQATFSTLERNQRFLLLLAPALFLATRTVSMLISAQIQGKPVVYRAWDTAWITALLLTFLIGIPFPVPGNLYIKGDTWKLEREKDTLALMARSGQLALALTCLFFTQNKALWFGLPLLILDTLFFFYPFCGFNARRIQRGGKASRITSFAVLIAVIVFVFL